MIWPPRGDWTMIGADIALKCGDCLEILPTMEEGCVDAVVADPPYGVNKAAWDTDFPTAWYSTARNVAETIYTMVGTSTLPKCIEMVGGDYQDMMAIWLSNGMTRGPLGFGNWLPIVVSQKHRRFLGGQNGFCVIVDTSEHIDHPSPKPIQAMVRLINNRDHQTILDPFAGSGTTAIACHRTGRRFIGIEISPEYFDIACRRIERELAQGILPFNENNSLDPNPKT